MRIDSARRLVAAPPGRVFRAFVEPESLVAWLPPEGMTARLIDFDAERGYRMVLTYRRPPTGGGKATPDEDISAVRRREVDPPRRIVEDVDFPSPDPAFAGTMTMTWTFADAGEGTVVTVEATNVPPGIRPEDHAVGLASSLDNLARLVEGAEG